MKKFLIAIIIAFSSLFSFANEATLALIEEAQKAQLENSKDAKSTWLKLAQNLDLLTQNGTKNANIYTMQGNAYLMANKLGLAIYSYENALIFAPNNEEILNNLNYAKSLCINEIEKNEKASLIDTYFYEADFTKNNALWIFLLSWNLVFIIALSKTKISEIKFLGIVSLVFALIFGTALAHEKYIEQTQKQGVVCDFDTIARKGASDIFMPAYKESIKDGTQFVILGSKNSWVHAKLRDGSTCWIDEKAIVKL